MNDLYKEFIEIRAVTDCVEGTLEVPQDAIGLVAFVHGIDGNHFSQHTSYVAEQLHKAHIGTLLPDLLTRYENKFYANRINIDLLTRRLHAVCRWLKKKQGRLHTSIRPFWHRHRRSSRATSCCA